MEDTCSEEPAKLGKYDKRYPLLDAKGIDVYIQMRTALRSGRERDVELLLERGVDVNAQCLEDCGALHEARLNGYE